MQGRTIMVRWCLRRIASISDDEWGWSFGFRSCRNSLGTSFSLSLVHVTENLFVELRSLRYTLRRCFSKQDTRQTRLISSLESTTSPTPPLSGSPFSLSIESDVV